MIAYPRVSEILAFYGAYKDYPSDPEYLKRGSWVHAACHIIGQGEELDDGTLAYGTRQGWMGYVAAYSAFRNEFNVVVTDAESAVTSHIERYIGHPDQIGSVAGRHAVIELKTGSLPKWVNLQLGFYALALNEGGNPVRRIAVQLAEDGKYHVQWGVNYADFDHCRMLVRAYHIAKERL